MKRYKINLRHFLRVALMNNDLVAVDVFQIELRSISNSLYMQQFGRGKRFIGWDPAKGDGISVKEGNFFDSTLYAQQLGLSNCGYLKSIIERSPKWFKENYTQNWDSDRHTKSGRRHTAKAVDVLNQSTGGYFGPPEVMEAIASQNKDLSFPKSEEIAKKIAERYRMYNKKIVKKGDAGMDERVQDVCKSGRQTISIDPRIQGRWDSKPRELGRGYNTKDKIIKELMATQKKDYKISSNPQHRSSTTDYPYGHDFSTPETPGHKCPKGSLPCPVCSPRKVRHAF